MNKTKPKGGLRCFPKMFGQIFGLILAALLASSAVSAAGTLDPNFGTGGKVSFRFGSTSIDSASDAVLQPDGKIIIVGRTAASDQSTSLRNFAIARLNADGTLDNTFGDGGKVITDFENGEDFATSVSLYSEGKFIVGGGRRTATSGNSLVFAFARYNPNGSLDTTFGIGGKVITDIPQPDGVIESIYSLSVQADGKILAIGTATGTSPAPQAQIIVTRYTANGSLDTSFGIGGIFKIAPGYYSRLLGAAASSDGKLLVAVDYPFNIPNCTPTKTNPCTGFDQIFLRYNTAGQQITLDRRFGRRAGREFIPFTYSQTTDGFTKLFLQPSGRFFYQEYAIQRIYSPSGRPAGTFDPVSINSQPVRVLNFAERPNGTIAGCGSVNVGGNSFDLATMLYTAEGRLIGTDTRDFLGGSESCSNVLAQPDNKIIVVANVRTSQNENYFGAMRYLDITP